MDKDNQKIILTKEGLAELKKEHEDLVEVKRPKAVKRVSTARELGDLSENSEYSSAKEEIDLLDGRIIELEEILKHSKVVSISKRSRKTVGLGCKVEVQVKGKKEIFTIVGEWETDPKKKKISHTSPLGKALVGKKPGEEVEVEAPVGKINYKILGIK